MIETAALSTAAACRTDSRWLHFTVAGIIALVLLAVLPMLMNMRDQWNEPNCNESHDTFVVQIAQAAFLTMVTIYVNQIEGLHRFRQ